MGLYRKLETDVDIEAPAWKFHEIIHKNPHHMSNIASDKIQSCELHEGEWGKVGSILYWNYVHDGKACVAKDVIEAVDEENNSITWKMIEGDLLELYKSFRITIQCTPKDKGSVIHYTLEYEKPHEDIQDSHGLLELCASMSKDIDAHLMGKTNEGSSIEVGAPKA
ncbi:MLP-like protein 43 [Benincasa hispida]|uniref:MLP-like protein 43 n=1 Tax=Benincasa hispida TaxID=102211 RepID=UPI0019003690|nr:MLP-like protein 43 [Benincasa hispida]